MASEIGVRMPAGWMTAADDRVLEYLASNGINPVKRVVDSGRVDYSRTTINLRLRILAEAGLVEDYDHGVYGISERGKQYLRGTEDMRDVPAPDARDHL